MRLVWQPQARDDLKRIGRYIVRDNPKAARRWVFHLRDRALQAARHPKSGRVVPEFERDDIREILVRNYRIVYLIRKNSVEILTVFEGHKLLDLEEKK